MVVGIKVKIRGTSDYLQHRRNPEDESDSTKKKNVVDYSKDADKALYLDEKIGVYIPSKQISKAMFEAGKNFIVKGLVNYSKIVDSTVQVIPDKISIGKKTYDYKHEEFGRIPPKTGSSVLISRPAFKKGWEAEFTMQVIDKDRLPIKVLKEIVEFAGKFVGIGDWRPHFGRFEVVEFK